MRLFFALEPAASTATAISDWRDCNLPALGVPVPPRNFHITLAFLGSLKTSALPQLCQSVDDWLNDNPIAGTTLTLNQVGYWPKPGIFWLGPSHWPDNLSSLAKKLNHLGIRAGATRDRNPFQPHVTLFRRCHTAPQPNVAPETPFPYAHFCLFESREGKNGVSYRSLSEWDLAH